MLKIVIISDSGGVMLRQFKGIKWINNIPNFVLYDYKNNFIEYKIVKGIISIKKEGLKKCNGYYDLATHKYIACPNFNNSKSDNVKQCETCLNITGFNECLGCDGKYCRTTNSIAKKFCTQKHVVYIALFGNNKFKVGTAAEYRKYIRILEQGAIASMFVAKTPDGKQARLIEHSISKLGYVLQVNSTFKMKNLIIDMERTEIENILKEHYNHIINGIPTAFKKCFIFPEINYCEKMNKINKSIFSPKEMQLSLLDNKVQNTYNINYFLNYDSICGRIANVVGTFLVVKSKNTFLVFDTKELEGYIVNIELS